MKEQTHAVDVRVLVKMVDPRRVERARAADDAVDFVAFFQQQLREIRAVLAGDAGDECFFHKWDFVLTIDRQVAESARHEQTLPGFESARFPEA